LGQYGFAPATTRFNKGATLGETHLQCDLPGATIKIYFDRVDLSATTRHYRKGLATTAVELVTRHVKKFDFSTIVASCHAHGTLPNTSSSDFLLRFVTSVPKDRGPIIGSAAVFYFGPHGPSLTSSLTLDLSAQVEGGIFLQEYVIYDASKIATTEVEAAFTRLIEEVLDQLDLEVTT